jgi:hypothetical protein
MSGPDKEDIETTLISPGRDVEGLPGAATEFTRALDELEALLKNGDHIAALTQRGINASIALVAVDGLRNYLSNRKAEAAGDFTTVAEEIRGRLALAEAERAAEGGPADPGRQGR